MSKTNKNNTDIYIFIKLKAQRKRENEGVPQSTVVEKVLGGLIVATTLELELGIMIQSLHDVGSDAVLLLEVLQGEQLLGSELLDEGRVGNELHDGAALHLQLLQSFHH